MQKFKSKKLDFIFAWIVVLSVLLSFVLWVIPKNNAAETTKTLAEKYTYKNYGVLYDYSDSYLDLAYLKKYDINFVYVNVNENVDYQSVINQAKRSKLKYGIFIDFDSDENINQQFLATQELIKENTGSLPIAIKLNNKDLIDESYINNLLKLKELLANNYQNEVLLMADKQQIKQISKYKVASKLNYFATDKMHTNKQKQIKFVELDNSYTIGKDMRKTKVNLIAEVAK